MNRLQTMGHGPYVWLVVGCLFSLGGIANAVMPPHYYQTLAKKAKIKAIAVVERVEVLREDRRSSTQRVQFRLEKAFFGSDVPKNFSGNCESVLHFWQKPGVGGTIYYYPHKGDRVFVAVSNNGGSIYSYTSARQ